jgi:hypothetical protein
MLDRLKNLPVVRNERERPPFYPFGFLLLTREEVAVVRSKRIARIGLLFLE